MNSTRYNQIIDEAYENYFNKFKDEWIKQYQSWLGEFNHSGRPISKEEFICKIKTDNEFSEKWGLHIEERELSLEERMNKFLKLGISPSEFRKGGNYGTVIPKERTLEVFDTNNIPTKLITTKYQNETIITYEQ